MKDEYKILIGAVIVILIVLVGAFALSGSNNAGPTATPTIAPVTATPTAVPAGNGGSNGGTPSANPTVAPTVVPPSPTPESGVKQTEFGYWITYPPLGPENWSAPKPRHTNVVYFDPTSDSVTIGYGGYIRPAQSEPVESQAIVHRDGDLDSTVNVIVHVTADNIEHRHFVSPEVEDSAFTETAFYDIGAENLTPISGDDYNLRFDPGVKEQAIYAVVSEYYSVETPELDAAVEHSYSGSLKLTITGVDGGFSISDKKEFTLNVNGEVIEQLPLVYFYRDWGYLNYDSSLHSGPYFGPGDVSSDDDYVYVKMRIQREAETSSALPVEFTVDSNIPGSAIAVDPFSFGAWDTNGMVTLRIDKDYVTSGTSYYVQLSIHDNDDYDVGDTFNSFRININAEL